eukprot:scaffold8015_cov277-Pinguiococcus_pyrenoidosus.AAC.5
MMRWSSPIFPVISRSFAFGAAGARGAGTPSLIPDSLPCTCSCSCSCSCRSPCREGLAEAPSQVAEVTSWVVARRPSARPQPRHSRRRHQHNRRHHQHYGRRHQHNRRRHQHNRQRHQQSNALGRLRPPVALARACWPAEAAARLGRCPLNRSCPCLPASTRRRLHLLAGVAAQCSACPVTARRWQLAVRGRRSVAP